MTAALTLRGKPRKAGHGRPIAERLLGKRVVTASGCWEWTGARSAPSGRPDCQYGVISVGGRQRLAHRVSYETFVGPIPAGFTIDHLCRNKGCINPAHLEPVTGPENQRRAVRILHGHPNAPTGCAKGHDWSVTPPYVSRRRDGSENRDCRICKRARQATYDAIRRSPRRATRSA